MNVIQFPNPCDCGKPGIQPDVTIAADHIVMGDITIPGAYVVQDGIVIHPGSTELHSDGSTTTTRDTPARITVTFMVGTISVESGADAHVRVESPLSLYSQHPLEEALPAEVGRVDV